MMIIISIIACLIAYLIAYLVTRLIESSKDKRIAEILEEVERIVYFYSVNSRIYVQSNKECKFLNECIKEAINLRNMPQIEELYKELVQLRACNELGFRRSI